MPQKKKLTIIADKLFT